MSIAERGDDPRRVLLIVYDHHQPLARSCFALEEPLPVRPAIWFPMVRRFDRVEDKAQIRLKLCVPTVRVQT
jgi:hypothetical protein